MEFGKVVTDNSEYELMNSCSGKCTDSKNSKSVYSSKLIQSGSCATATTCNSSTS